MSRSSGRARILRESLGGRRRNLFARRGAGTVCFATRRLGTGAVPLLRRWGVQARLVLTEFVSGPQDVVNSG